MATPRDMDPNFKDEKATAKRDDVETVDATNDPMVKRDDVETVESTTDVNTVKDVRESEDTPMIVCRRPGVDANGQPTVVEHGPMPVKDWADYERENNL